MTPTDRATGCLLGLACGDALGRPVEGHSGAEIVGQYGRVTEMRAGGPGAGTAGSGTEETALALLVARSLVACSGFDDADLSARLVDWHRTDPVGVGPTTAAGIVRLRDGGLPDDVDGRSGDDRSGGVGADADVLARAVPPAVAYRDAPDRLADVVAATARLTHRTSRAVEASVAFARVVAALLGGTDPEAACDAALATAVRRNVPAAVRTALATATDPGTASPGPGGEAVATLETALHDGLTAATPEAVVVGAVCRGGRTTAVGAAAGAVAGARFGGSAIPDRWLDHLDAADECRELAVALVEGSFD